MWSAWLGFEFVYMWVDLIHICKSEIIKTNAKHRRDQVTMKVKNVLVPNVTISRVLFFHFLFHFDSIPLTQSEKCTQEKTVRNAFISLLLLHTAFIDRQSEIARNGWKSS